MSNASNGCYNPTEAAKKLRVSRFTLYRWIAEEKISATNVGEGTERPRWQFSDSDIETIKESMSGFYRKHPNRKPRVVEKKEERKVEKYEKISYVELLEENKRLHEEIEKLRSDKSKLFSELLEIMAKYE